MANTRKLEALGCDSAADVRDLDPRVARQVMIVVGGWLVRKLRSEACLDLEEVDPTRRALR